MQIDEHKLKRQNWQVQEWIRTGCQGTLQAVTGFGKTYTAILAIQRLHRKYPDVLVDVVLPKINLYLDWVNPKTGHLAVHNLKNVEPFVVNTYVKFGRRRTGLLILDEGHNYASEEWIKVFEVAGCKVLRERKTGDCFILLLTATLERLDHKHKILEEYAPIFDTVTMEEAKANGYISNYTIYNWGLELTEEDRQEYEKWHNIFNNAFGKFGHNFELAMACAKDKDVTTQLTVNVGTNGQVGFQSLTKTSKDWQYWYALQQEWDGKKDSMWSPFNISKAAQQFMTAMRNRKTFVFTAEIKFISVIELVTRMQVKTMIFSEVSVFADRIADALGDKCMAYHTNIPSQVQRVEIIDKHGKITYKDKKIGKDKFKQMILEEFKKPDGFPYLSSVRSLKEGFDYARVKLIIMASYNSSKREDTQTSGRGTRRDYANLDKEAIIVNMYITDSQEEKWLKEKQKGKQGIRWIKSIDEIEMNNQTNVFDVKLE